MSLEAECDDTEKETEWESGQLDSSQVETEGILTADIIRPGLGSASFAGWGLATSDPITVTRSAAQTARGGRRQGQDCSRSEGGRGERNERTTKLNAYVTACVKVEQKKTVAAKPTKKRKACWAMGSVEELSSRSSVVSGEDKVQVLSSLPSLLVGGSCILMNVRGLSTRQTLENFVQDLHMTLTWSADFGGTAL